MSVSYHRSLPYVCASLWGHVGEETEKLRQREGMPQAQEAAGYEILCRQGRYASEPVSVSYHRSMPPPEICRLFVSSSPGNFSQQEILEGAAVSYDSAGYVTKVSFSAEYMVLVLPIFDRLFKFC